MQPLDVRVGMGHPSDEEVVVVVGETCTVVTAVDADGVVMVDFASSDETLFEVTPRTAPSEPARSARATITARAPGTATLHVSSGAQTHQVRVRVIESLRDIGFDWY